MINVKLTNTMLNQVLAIEALRHDFKGDSLPVQLSSHMRKLSRKQSSHASLKIEGNPLTQEQASQAIDDARKHFLKPEEEVRNYYAALELLAKRSKESHPLDLELLLETQALVVKGESAEKVGLRGPMPPGVLFAVYDSATGEPEYIPPESSDIEPLLNELFEYIADSDDHPLVKAAVVHYQIATIHPFVDGNGRTARLMSDYYLDVSGFGFAGLGSLEEFFSYDIDEYYDSLQMGLPPLYYEGRENPPHPEIWVEYFLHMVELYANKTSSLVDEATSRQNDAGLSHLSNKERSFYDWLIEEGVDEFRPVDLAAVHGVSNRTIINWSAALSRVGLLEPQLVNQRIRSYRVMG